MRRYKSESYARGRPQMMLVVRWHEGRDNGCDDWFIGRKEVGPSEGEILNSAIFRRRLNFLNNTSALVNFSQLNFPRTTVD